MYVVYPDTMGKIDSKTPEKYGIKSLILMENASIALSNYIISNFSGRRITILAGPGNNGGDGLALARHLLNKNYSVKVFLFAKPSKYSDDSRTNYDILKKMNGEIINGFKHKRKLVHAVKNADIIVDGLFGTGFKGEIRDNFLHVFKTLEKYDATVVSIDIPSGLNGTTGIPAEHAVKAHSTVSFAAAKTGMLWNRAMGHVGNLIIADISIPKALIEKHDPYFLLDREMVGIIRSDLPGRKQWLHKMEKGRIGVIGGNSGMQGAPQMTGMAGLKTGAGIVYVHLLKKTDRKFYPEIVFSNSYKDIIKNNNTIVLGPGLGRDSRAESVVSYILKRKRKNKNIIIDADAINIIAKMPNDIKKVYLRGRIVTPHPGEFKRLTGKSFDSIDEKISLSREFCKTYNTLLVHKSPPTIITDSQTTFIFPFMSEKLATAGSGDALSGIIAGFLAGHVNPFYAALLGVYIHFRAGADLDNPSPTAGNIIDNISLVMEDFS